MFFLTKINRRHDEFAEELSKKFQEVVHPGMTPAKLDKPTRKKLDKLIHAMIKQTLDYKREHNPGIYGKARINNTIIWKLKEQGYSEELINLAMRPVMDALTK